MPIKQKESPVEGKGSVNSRELFNLKGIVAEKSSNSFMSDAPAFGASPVQIKWNSPKGYLGLTTDTVDKVISTPLKYLKYIDENDVELFDYEDNDESKAFFKEGIKMQKAEAKDAFITFLN